MKCCICEKDVFFGLLVLKYHKKLCTACKASFIGLINFEHDVDIPINDTMGFTFFTPIEYTQYPTGKIKSSNSDLK